MSIMVVSTPGRFSAIAEKIENPAVRNIHFYNSRLPQGLAGPVLSLLPFIDLVVFDTCSFRSPRLSLLRREAERLQVSFVEEERLTEALSAESGFRGKRWRAINRGALS